MSSRFWQPLASLCVASIGFCGIAVAKDLDIDITGVAVIETAVDFDGQALQKSEFTLTPTIEIDLSPRTKLVTSGRFRADAADELEPGRPFQTTRATGSDRVFIGDRSEIELREAYFQTKADGVTFTLGKQETVWGQSDGLKVLDIVNPQSFREFILADFATSRIPLWTAKVESQFGNWEVQAIWVFDQTADEFVDAPGEYTLTAPRFSAPLMPIGLPIVDGGIDRPSNRMRGSDLGIRLSRFWNGFDFTLNYLWRLSDRPVFRITSSGTEQIVRQEYDRNHLAGGTISRTIGDFVLRGEVGFLINEAYTTTPVGGISLPEETTSVKYVAGLDWYGLGDTLVSVQFFQQALFRDISATIAPRVDNFVTAAVRQTFFRDTTTFSFIGLTNLNDGDWLLRPKFEYDISDAVGFSVGADIFIGDADQTFGQFEDATRVIAAIEFRF